MTTGASTNEGEPQAQRGLPKTCAEQLSAAGDS